MKAWDNQFYYITHIDNLPSLLENGILSHNKVEESRFKPVRISDKEIVDCRKDITTDSGKSLWDYSNVYFRARNAMLYKMVQKFGKENIIVLGIKSSILKIPGTYITTGNARSPSIKIYPAKEISQTLKEIYPFLKKDWWENSEDKIGMMAECLVPDIISKWNIQAIYVADYNIQGRVNKRGDDLIKKLSINIIPEPALFKNSNPIIEITNSLSLVEGDMIFSNMQTLTVSVNTVGVMGAGLAARVKEQFPDVYEFYCALCEKKVLQMGEPYLFKRKVLISKDLGDGNSGIEEEPTWFLLFPTKLHFREKSDIKGIETGLIWLKENYSNWGIKSLALPALGCGLGWLNWKDIGPIMVKHLKDLKIPVQIYLPREIKINRVYLTKEYLLKDLEQKTLSS